MSTDSERDNTELQYSVEEYKQLWEFLRVLHQDRRHVWLFLTTALLGLPAAAAALAGKEGLGTLLDQYAHAVGAFLIVLWLVGFLGFVHLIHLRRQLVEYTREINRIRGFWVRRGVPLAQPSKVLLLCEQHPKFWELSGANVWFAAPIVIIVSVVASLASLAWTAAFENWGSRVPGWLFPAVGCVFFLGSLALMSSLYWRAMLAFHRDWCLPCCSPGPHDSASKRFSRRLLCSLAIVVFVLSAAGCVAWAAWGRTPALPKQEQGQTAHASSHERHRHGHARGDEHRTHQSGHLTEEHERIAP